MALLFAYGLNYLMNPDITYLRSRANLIALMWLVLAIVQFLAYALYAWNFGFASERMVLLPHWIQIDGVGQAGTACVVQGDYETECRVF
jgi:hypothetical protein